MPANLYICLGNLTRDPEMKYTPKGTAVCSFSVAMSSKYVTDSGEKREEVLFMDMEAWGKTAENICQYFKKGKPIYIEGALKQDEWDDKQTGQKRTKIKCTVRNWTFAGGDKEDGGAKGGGEYDQRPQNQQQQRPAGNQQQRPAATTSNVPEDDIPF